MTASTPVDIHVTRDFAASAERVYTSFTAPAELARWFGPVGWSADPGSIVVEPRPYGRYRVTLRSDEDPTLTYVIRARILELIPGRLVIVEERTAARQMELQVDITPTSADTCRVDLRQGPYDEDTRAMAAVSWESALSRLAATVRPRVALTV